MENKIEIGPTEIAKFLCPLKKSPVEMHGCLVERIGSELGIDNQLHAEWIIDYLEGFNYLSKEELPGPWDSDMSLYSLTKKGEEFMQKYL